MKKLLILVAFIPIFSYGNAQSLTPYVFGSFGGEAANSEVQLIYTGGQSFYETGANANNLLTQGFNQPLANADVTDDIELPEMMEFSVFPNPAKGLLNIQTTDSEFFEARMVIYDIQGRILIEQTAVNKQEQISLINLPANAYFLRITKNGKPVYFTKIIKSN